MMLYRWDILGLPIYRIGPVPDGAGGRPDAVVDGGLPEGRLAGPDRHRTDSVEGVPMPGRLDLAGAEPTICALFDAGIAQLVERNLAKVEVASSSLVSRSSSFIDRTARWQSGHAAACKAVYAGSIPTLASSAPDSAAH